MKKWIYFVLTTAVIVCNPPHKNADIKLVVFISIDHLRPDLLTRFDDLYTGGFRWFIDHSLWFTNTHHEHAYTATGPGHFVLGSGRHPGPSGILGNSWYDPEKKEQVYCVEDSLSNVLGGGGRKVSYRNIDCTGLGDWIKKSNPKSKVYSVAGKDRTSIFLGGKNPDLAIWYDWQGHYVTSDYYISEVPDWLIQFNQTLHIENYRDSLWRRTLDSETYIQFSREDNFFGESDIFETDPYSPVFPLGFGSEEDIFDNIGRTPWFEKFTLNLASTIVIEEQLGTDKYPDILFVGLSATDWIIHNWGPFSQEAMDLMLKLDQYFNDFLISLDQSCGLENIQFILTSDHGGLPIPEYLEKIGIKHGGRINRDSYISGKNAILNEIEIKYDEEDLVKINSGRFYYNHQKLKVLKIDQLELHDIIRTHITSIAGISRLITRTEIYNASENDTLLQRFKNYTHPTKGPDAVILLDKNWTFRNPYGTGHGTPYDYDSHVPLLFVRKGQDQRFIRRKIHTVDIAPTIADILQVPFPPKIDGKSIFEVQE